MGNRRSSSAAPASATRGNNLSNNQNNQTIVCVGRVSTVLVELEVVPDTVPSPPKMAIRFRVQPPGPISEQAVWSDVGLVARLSKHAPVAVADGAVTFDWTDENRPKFHNWLRELIQIGFPTDQVARLAQAMDATKVGITRPAAQRIKQGIDAIPDGSLIRLDNLEKAPDHVWKAVQELPGAFWLSPSGKPTPVKGSGMGLRDVADSYYDRYKAHPSPVYVSGYVVDQVARVSPSIAAQADQIKRDLGIIYPLYPPSAFPVPGVNPDDGQRMTLWPHQVDGISKFIAMKRMVFAWAVGAGKTPAVIAGNEFLRRQGLIDRAVIAVPQSLLGQWRQYINVAFLQPCVIAHGSRTARLRAYHKAISSGIPYILISHDACRLPDAQTYLATLLGPRTHLSIDEVHAFRHADTKKFQAMMELADGWRVGPGGTKVQRRELITNYRSFLSGTIIWDRVLDLDGPTRLLGFHLYNSVDEIGRLYMEREWVPTKHFGPDGERVMKVRVTRVKQEKLPLLHEVLSVVTHHKTLADIGISLPPLRKTKMVIEPSPLEDWAYKVIRGELRRLEQAVTVADRAVVPGQKSTVEAAQKIQSDLFAVIAAEREFSADPGTLLLPSEGRYIQYVQGLLGHDRLMSMTPGSKLQALIEYLGNFLRQPGAKVVCFSSFVKTLTILQALIINPPARLDADLKQTLIAFRRTALFYHGEMTPTKREEVIARFKTDPNIRILFASDAASQGLNLQGVANYIIHIDAPLALGVWTQREGRVYRSGQTLPVLVISLYLGPSLEFEKELQSLSLTAGKLKWMDSRLKALLTGKGTERESVEMGF